MEDTKFNLERALAGDPVETMDGDLVTEIYHLKTVDENNPYKVIAVIKGKYKTFTKEGVFRVDAPYISHLRMKKKVYMAHLIINKGDGSTWNYQTKEEAEQVEASYPNTVYKRIEFTL